MIFKNSKLKQADPIKYVVRAGNNTAWVSNEKRTWLASLSQLAPIAKSDEVEPQTPLHWRSKKARKPPEKLDLSKGANATKSKKK